MRFDDWIPTLERAVAWNNWSEEEKLMQLAGHLRSKALQEWGLMSPDKKWITTKLLSLCELIYILVIKHLQH